MAAMPPRGRPPVGDRIEVRLPADVLHDLDTDATELRVSRAEVVRRIIRRFYNPNQKDTDS